MCYHVKPPQDADQAAMEFDARFGRPEYLDYKKHFLNGFEHPHIPIILDESPQEIITGTWGLIPGWAANKEPKEFYKTANTLNAKVEEVHQKASYKSYVDNRCLILVESFKEWKHVPGLGKKVDKVPYEISMPDGSLFAIAGIYSLIHGEPTITLLTTTANTLMAEIHNSAKRMPVVLNKDERKLWLQRDKLEPYHARTEIELKAEPIIEPGMPAPLF